MLEPKFIQIFVKPLEERGINYLVSGSIASIIYGEPRATMDIDIGIFLNPSDYKLLAEIFPESEFYTPPVEVIRIESERESRGHYNVIHHATGLKSDFYPSRNHPLLPWALRNKVVQEIGGIRVSVAPPEYVILWKLEFYRESQNRKHLRDILGILKTSKQKIDFSLLHDFTKELHLQDAWDTLDYQSNLKQ